MNKTQGNNKEYNPLEETSPEVRVITSKLLEDYEDMYRALKDGAPHDEGNLSKVMVGLAVTQTFLTKHLARIMVRLDRIEAQMPHRAPDDIEAGGDQ